MKKMKYPQQLIMYQKKIDINLMKLYKQELNIREAIDIVYLNYRVQQIN